MSLDSSSNNNNTIETNSRRNALKNIAYWFWAMATPELLAFWHNHLIDGTYKININKHKITTDKLAPWKKYMIVHLTDFHIQEWLIFDEKRMLSLIELLNNDISQSWIKKDNIIVTMTWDYINDHRTPLDYLEKTIGHLQKLHIDQDSIFYVLWNHDKGYKSEIVQLFDKLWFNHAENDLTHKFPFTIIWTKDYCTEWKDFDSDYISTLKNKINPELFSLFLSHDPTALEECLLEEFDEQTDILFLSWHTHGFYKSKNSKLNVFNYLRWEFARYKLKNWSSTWKIAEDNFGTGFTILDSNKYALNTNGLWDWNKYIGWKVLWRSSDFEYSLVTIEWKPKI